MRHLFDCTILTLVLAICLARPGHAQDCETVTFVDIGWTDITATTAVVTELLHDLGYETEVTVAPLPMALAQLAQGDVDVFMGLWLPRMTVDVQPYLDSVAFETVATNLSSAKFTLATNAAGAALGINSFADIAAHQEALEGRIYGLEPGNGANFLLLRMVALNKFALGTFEIIESSEQAMLAQVRAAEKKDAPVIFLGSTPHPMNAEFEVSYLDGGDDIFGPNFGSGRISTAVRDDLKDQCPNVLALLRNIQFTPDMETAIMSDILDQNQAPSYAARDWMSDNRETLIEWVSGVTTAAGGDPVSAIDDAKLDHMALD